MVLWLEILVTRYVISLQNLWYCSHHVINMTGKFRSCDMARASTNVYTWSGDMLESKLRGIHITDTWHHVTSRDQVDSIKSMLYTVTWRHVTSHVSHVTYKLRFRKSRDSHRGSRDRSRGVSGDHVMPIYGSQSFFVVYSLDLYY